MRSDDPPGLNPFCGSSLKAKNPRGTGGQVPQRHADPNGRVLTHTLPFHRKTWKLVYQIPRSRSLSVNTLYGTTYRGGTSGNGTVFAVHTNGTGFTKLHDFAGYPDEGGNPYGLILSGNTLFGMSFYGGRSDYGTAFSLSLGR